MSQYKNQLTIRCRYYPQIKTAFQKTIQAQMQKTAH